MVETHIFHMENTYGAEKSYSTEENYGTEEKYGIKKKYRIEKTGLSAREYSTIKGGRKKLTGGRLMEAVFAMCAAFVVFTAAAMTFYLFFQGLPGVEKAGWKEILFQTAWKPAASEPSYGILNIILTSVTGTFFAVLIGVPAGILTAVFLAEMSGKRASRFVKPAVELLAGIPSVIYGLLGLYLLNPLMYRLERKLFEGSETHQFTGGANLFSAVLVLAVMILPTVINVSETALRAVSPGIREASLALGATRMQTVFRAVLPAAGSGILTAAVLGVGRAMGEAMAIMMVSGNSVNEPLPFHSVRFLATAIVSEMAYAQGTHRQVLFAVGLVLFLFIMLVNLVLHCLVKKGAGENE